MWLESTSTPQQPDSQQLLPACCSACQSQMSAGQNHQGTPCGKGLTVRLCATVSSGHAHTLLACSLNCCMLQEKERGADLCHLHAHMKLLHCHCYPPQVAYLNTTVRLAGRLSGRTVASCTYLLYTSDLLASREACSRFLNTDDITLLVDGSTGMT